MKLRLPAWLWPENGRLGLAEWLTILCMIALLGSGLFWASQPVNLVHQAQDQQRKSDLVIIQQALQKYAEDHNGQYPIVSSGAGYYSCYNCGWSKAEVEASSNQPYTANNWIPDLVEQGYLNRLPSDPWQGAVRGCQVSGYIYLSGGVGYKVFDWCGPRTGLAKQATETTYCHRPPYDGSQLDAQPANAEPLPEMVDPARPGWAYAIYTYELACY